MDNISNVNATLKCIATPPQIDLDFKAKKPSINPKGIEAKASVHIFGKWIIIYGSNIIAIDKLPTTLFKPCNKKLLKKNSNAINCKIYKNSQAKKSNILLPAFL